MPSVTVLSCLLLSASVSYSDAFHTSIHWALSCFHINHYIYMDTSIMTLNKLRLLVSSLCLFMQAPVCSSRFKFKFHTTHYLDLLLWRSTCTDAGCSFEKWNITIRNWLRIFLPVSCGLISICAAYSRFKFGPATGVLLQRKLIFYKTVEMCPFTK